MPTPYTWMQVILVWAKRCLGFILSLGMNGLFASTPLPFSLPKPLLIHGKPLPPQCMMAFVNESQDKAKVNLQTDACLGVEKPYQAHALREGFLGYEMATKTPSMRPPSIYYRYVGEINTHNQPTYVFEIEWSGGGSGFFSALMMFGIDHGLLTHVKTIDSGDRCTGGIRHATIQQGVIAYEKNITPHMLIDAQLDKQKRHIPFVLQDCAVCCIGTLQIKNQHIEGFQWNGEKMETAPKDNAQRCFNQQATQHGALKKSTLTPQELRAFQNSIITQCLP